METQVNSLSDPDVNQSPVEMTENAFDHLDELRKWALVIALGGFVGTVVLFICGISMLIVPNSTPAAGFIHLMSGGYLFVAFISAVPMWFLWKAARHARKTVKLKLSSELETTFKNLKYHYICLGIFSLLSLITIIATVIAAVMSGLLTSIMQSPTV